MEKEKLLGLNEGTKKKMKELELTIEKLNKEKQE